MPTTILHLLPLAALLITPATAIAPPICSPPVYLEKKYPLTDSTDNLLIAAFDARSQTAPSPSLLTQNLEAYLFRLTSHPSVRHLATVLTPPKLTPFYNELIYYETGGPTSIPVPYAAEAEWYNFINAHRLFCNNANYQDWSPTRSPREQQQQAVRSEYGGFNLQDANQDQFMNIEMASFMLLKKLVKIDQSRFGWSTIPVVTGSIDDTEDLRDYSGSFVKVEEEIEQHGSKMSTAQVQSNDQVERARENQWAEDKFNMGNVPEDPSRAVQMVNIGLAMDLATRTYVMTDEARQAVKTLLEGVTNVERVKDGELLRDERLDVYEELERATGDVVTLLKAFKEQPGIRTREMGKLELDELINAVAPPFANQVTGEEASMTSGSKPRKGFRRQFKEWLFKPKGDPSRMGINPSTGNEQIPDPASRNFEESKEMQDDSPQYQPGQAFYPTFDNQPQANPNLNFAPSYRSIMGSPEQPRYETQVPYALRPDEDSNPTSQNTGGPSARGRAPGTRKRDKLKSLFGFGNKPEESRGGNNAQEEEDIDQTESEIYTSANNQGGQMPYPDDQNVSTARRGFRDKYLGGMFKSRKPKDPYSS